MDKQTLYDKYTVTRNDGEDDYGAYGGRGEYPPADYFILKLNSGYNYDLDALEAYAESCKNEMPKLSYELLKKVNFHRERLVDFGLGKGIKN